MTFGDLFWILMWIATWATVIGCAAAGVVFIRDQSDERPESLFIGGGFLTGALLLALAAGAVATGEWNPSASRLLPDGCYRVGHEFVGKGIHNTYAPAAGC